MRFYYYCPCTSNRNVIPYHPTVLLLWRAQMNLQRVTQDAWSYYMLDYSMKTEPMGKLTLSTENATKLGLCDVSEAQLRIIENMVIAQPISPCEAALMLAEIPVVEMSSIVEFVDTSHPDERQRFVLKNSSCPPCLVHKYENRPSRLSDVSFPEYF